MERRKHPNQQNHHFLNCPYTGIGTVQSCAIPRIPLECPAQGAKGNSAIGLSQLGRASDMYMRLRPFKNALCARLPYRDLNSVPPILLLPASCPPTPPPGPARRKKHDSKRCLQICFLPSVLEIEHHCSEDAHCSEEHRHVICTRSAAARRPARTFFSQHVSRRTCLTLCGTQLTK